MFHQKDGDRPKLKKSRRPKDCGLEFFSKKKHSHQVLLFEITVSYLQ